MLSNQFLSGQYLSSAAKRVWEPNWVKNAASGIEKKVIQDLEKKGHKVQLVDAPKKSPETIGEEVSVKEKLRKLQELKGLISDEKFSQKEDALMKEFGID